MAIKYLKPNTLTNQTVLLRVDVNEGVDHEGNLMDDFRLHAVVPTIKILREGGNKILVCGHLGRPRREWEEDMSLRPVAKRFAELLDLKFVETDKELPSYPAVGHLIFYTGKLTEDSTKKQLAKQEPKDVILLENLRFYPGEETNDPVFAQKLASLAQNYVNDAFSVSHRSQASVDAITKLLPSFAGPLLEKEIKFLSAVLEKAKKPFVVMMGGIKVSDKAATIEHLGKAADKILLGGGLANLFLLAQGMEVGHSKVEKSSLSLAKEMLRELKGKIILPTDVVVTDPSMSKESMKVKAPYEIGKMDIILDIGPKTILNFTKELQAAKTIVWNGPMGHFEMKPFDTGTSALAKVIGGVGTRKAFAVVGGGETVDAVRLAGQMKHMDHVSTGGGAMLEFLAGKKLPGLEALK